MDPTRDETLTRTLGEAGRRREQALSSGDGILPALPAGGVLAAIMQSAAEAMLGTTLAGIITSWNPAAERLYGYAAAEAIGQPLALIVPAEQQDALAAIMARLRAGERCDHVETLCLHKDGTRLAVSMRMSPIRDETGSVVGVASVGRERPEQRRGAWDRQALGARGGEVGQHAVMALAETDAMLEVFHRIGRLLGAELDLERLIQAVTDAATTLTSAQFGAFFYNAENEQGEHYTLYAVSGAPREAFSRFPLPRNTAMFGPTFRGEGTVRIADVRHDARFGQNAPYYGLPEGHLPVVSYLAVPVMGREGTVLGGLFFAHNEPGVFAEPAERLAEGLAGLAALAVENARLFQRAQRELQARTESEERFRTAFDSAAIGMALVDLGGRIVQVNPALCALTGYTEAELLARTVADITHPDDVATDLAQMQRLVAGESDAYQMEKRYLDKSGQVVWGHLSASIVRDAQGAPLYFIGQFTDITARKEAELALEGERDLLHALMANLPDAVYFKDAQHRFTRVNPTAAALYGLDDPAAAVGLTDFDFYPREQARLFWEDERPVLEAGTPLVNRLERQAESGDAWQWTLATKVPIVEPGGQIAGLVGISRDVSDVVRARDELQLSEERFRTAFDDAAIGMGLVDLHGNFVRVNAAFCQLTGYSEPELLTRTFQDLTHPDDREQELAHLAQLLAGEIRAYAMEKRYLHKDGAVIWIRVNTSLVRDEQGEPLHFIGQVEDITARKRAEDELREALAAAREANRAKGQFLDIMSHELRTPLQAVLGYSELLLQAPEGDLTAEQREDLDAIHRASGRMTALINQVLDLSRMDARRLELARDPVDLGPVLEAVRQDIAPQAAAKGLAVQIEAPASLPQITGDAERVRQILLNLAGNAVKFTDAGGIRLTATPLRTGVVEVAVRDTGVGIPAEALPHIFEPFRQVGQSLTRRQGGSGLGLAIAERLAQQMGGAITVSSEPGAGSVFRLRLPRAS